MPFKRRGHRLQLDGPGRMRCRIAEMLLQQLQITADPYDIYTNNTPSSRMLDLCRWCVDGKTADGRHVHVCSWDRMTDIIKAKKIAVVEDDPHHFEVCRGT